MPNAYRSSWRPAGAVALVVALIAAMAMALPQRAWAEATTVTQSYGYTGSTATFTVPAGVTQLTLNIVGAEGGQGGADAAGPSPQGGYQGVVSGTISVTPGQVLTIAVGGGGATGTSHATGSTSPPYTSGAAVGGSNPLSATYAGGNGGVAGFQGSSGDGGAGGAATVITTAGATIVAGGAGGAGGSGQYSPTLGRIDASSFTARSDTTSTNGQVGITVATVCNNAPSPGCDGGGSGGGGGGLQGGAQGGIQFGSGTSDEWYGYGGSPGQNSTGGLSGLSAAYDYYSDDNEAGSVTIIYSTGAPGAPTGVSGVAGNTTVNLSWTAPAIVGDSDITSYVVQYAPQSNPTDWTTFGSVTNTSATVTGLVNGTAYIFQVAAVNSTAQGAFSASSAAVTPSGPPAAPTINTVSPEDGALTLAFTPGASGSPVTDYEYMLDNDGTWQETGDTSSPVVVPGLVNGTSYSVELRAVSIIGNGAASSPASGTPEAVPGAPTITSVTTGVGTASVSFTPGYAGGGTITGYQYQLNGGSWVNAGTTTSPVQLTGLANATTYSIVLEALNGAGAGAPSSSYSVTTPGPPAAPTVSSVTAGDGTLSIAFSPGASGGSAITSYQYQLTSGGSWATAATTSSPVLVSGLTDGTAYQVSLRAVNAVGPGTASSATTATPATVPGAPTITGSTVAGSNGQLSAAFTPPASNGGATITDYQYSTDSGATWADAGTTTSPIVISTLSSNGTTPLVNGTTYDVELRAVNSAGVGLASALATGIPESTPAAPTLNSVTAEDGALQVSFTPGANGGAAITEWEYSTDASTWHDTGTLGDSFTITGLTDGTTYPVSVRGVNSQGNGAPSTAVNGSPSAVPAQPTISGVVRGNQTLTVSVSDPSSNGSPITSWQYSTDGGSTWYTAAQSSSPLVITTLSTNGTTPIANGTAYPVTVRAVNGAGPSAASNITTAGPSTSPPAPSVTLTPGDGSIQVAYTLSGNGGSPLTEVEYQLNGGSWQNAGTLSSPFTINSLTDGTTYSVVVRADNAIGTGTASTSASATPATVPGPPTAVQAASAPAAAQVTWTAPASDGGSPVVLYTASAYTSPSSGSAVSTCTSVTTSCTISGLTNGTLYYVSVVATNTTGTGPASAPQAQVTPLAPPSAPTLGTLTPGDTVMTLTFTAPSNTGGSAITGYDYQLNGGSWQAAGTTSSPIVISGLTDGTSYTVALRADNAAGTGTASSTLSATPYTYPDAPDASTVVATGENNSILVSWQAPASNGSAITSYTATAFSALTAGSQVSTCTASTLSCTITGLTNGTTYYVSLQAQNAAGLSARSAPRVPATPSQYPGAVQSLTGVAGNGQVELSWSPGSIGASSIVSYTVAYSSGGSYTVFGTAGTTTATVTGLTNGTPYTFEVLATNTQGPGPYTSPSAPVTPFALSISSAVLVDGQVGTAYDVVPTATGPGSYTWSVSGGALPAGLSIDPSTGEVSGTPTAPGLFTFNLVASEASVQTATQAESVTIAPAPVPPAPATTTTTTTPTSVTVPGAGTGALSITSALLPGGRLGTPYGAQLSATGGTTPYLWALSSGSLPAGLSLDSSTGRVSGTPTALGTSTFVVTVTGPDGQQAQQAETVVIAPAVVTGGGAAALPAGDGYWALSSQGQLSSHGAAAMYGSENDAVLNAPVVAINATATGTGYWEAAADGGVFNFGDAHFYGSMSGAKLNGPVVGMARTPDNGGYWLVAKDGGVFNFGDAHFYGSLGSTKLTSPIVAIAATPDGHGYWLASADGQVYTFGDAHRYGSMLGRRLNGPIVGMAATPDGHGYWLVGADGGVFNFGDARFYGSLGATKGHQVVGIIAWADLGYRLIGPQGTAYPFGTN